MEVFFANNLTSLCGEADGDALGDGVTTGVGEGVGVGDGVGVGNFLTRDWN